MDREYWRPGGPPPAQALCLCALVCSLFLGADRLLAAGPATAVPNPNQLARAVVTFVEGQVLLIESEHQTQDVRIGAELLEDTMLRLEGSARLVVLWDHGETATLQGPAEVVALEPFARPKGGTLKKAVTAVRNVWNALCSKLGELCKGRERGVKLTEEPLAVRGIERDWAVFPSNERVRPGACTLQWRSSSQQGCYYTVTVWEADFSQVWRATTQAQCLTVPGTAGLVPGKRYLWLAVPTTGDADSQIPCWFEILTTDESARLDSDIRAVNEILGQVEPPSQLHAALGCILERYGLHSEAGDEYKRAAQLSPSVYEYKTLATDQPEKVSSPERDAPSGDADEGR